MNVFDMDRLAIGGMSGGGMAALVRLTRPHPFQCASVEATSGSWEHLLERSAIRRAPADAFHAINPIENLQSWREIPFQAIHARGDEWMPYESQEAFIDELRRRYDDPELIEFVTYSETGAPYEHVGFGRKTADAKNRQLAFLKRWLDGTLAK
jgi:dipeptidyl aminopeptidase/acylaminoacyl peptidase